VAKIKFPAQAVSKNHFVHPVAGAIWEGEVVTLLGEYSNAPGHVVVAGADGQIYQMLHIGDFQIFPRD